MNSNGLINLEFEGKAIRMVGTPEDPLWVAADVCRVLGIANPSQAVSSFRESEKGISNIYTPRGGEQEMNVVTLPGLLRLIMRSNKKIAERFQVFTFHDVLPSVLRYGCYPPPKIVEGNTAIVQTSDQLVKLLDQFVLLSGKVDKLDDMVALVFDHLRGVVRRYEFSQENKSKMVHVLAVRYNGFCPCCYENQVYKNGEFNGEHDHWYAPNRNTIKDGWPVCVDCNVALKDITFRQQHADKFTNYQAVLDIVFEIVRIGKGQYRLAFGYDAA